MATALGLARTTLVAIEKGERRVRPDELVQLANLLERPVSELLQRGAPEESFAVQLRGALQPAGPIDSGLLPAIDELQHLCEDYRWLEGLRGAPMRRRYPPPYEVEGLDPYQAAEDVATEERKRLGLGDGPLLNIRDVLEADVGLRIFLVALPPGIAGMYAFAESLGGCIGVNQDHPGERQHHTIAHEFGHFLTSRYRSEVLRDGRFERLPHYERFAEGFARAFLLPASGVRRRFLDLQRERRGAISRGDLLRLARFFAVSVEAMVRRLEELNLLPAGVWDRLQEEGLRIRDAQRLLGLEPLVSDDKLPARFVTLAVEAWGQGELSEGQLARLLRTTRLEVRSRTGGTDQAPLPGDALDLGSPLVRSGGG